MFWGLTPNIPDLPNFRHESLTTSTVLSVEHISDSDIGAQNVLMQLHGHQ